MGIFRAKLPVDQFERDWVDRSLNELAGLFGPATEWPTILPTAEYFPADFDGTTGAVQALLERACGWLQIDPAELDLDVFSDPAGDEDDEQRSALPFAAKWVSGDYVPIDEGRGTIGIHQSNLQDPLTLVATIGHELCHHLLISHKQIDRTRPDNEGLTDLLTTHLGFGIMSTNAQRRYRASYNGGWSSSSLGYLSSQTYGYALACRVRSVNEIDPTWSIYLAPNPRGFMRASLKAIAQGQH
jgi:hypothetical protein